jgi:drug/metabolite transporter (DMT)-like permease
MGLALFQLDEPSARFGNRALVGLPVRWEDSLSADFFGMSLLNNVIPFSLIVWGQTHIASGLASILNATTPVFTVVMAHFLMPDEKMTRNRLLGVLVGVVGVAVLIGPETLEGLGGNAAPRRPVSAWR